MDEIKAQSQQKTTRKFRSDLLETPIQIPSEPLRLKGPPQQKLTQGIFVEALILNGLHELQQIALDILIPHVSVQTLDGKVPHLHVKMVVVQELDRYVRLQSRPLR